MSTFESLTYAQGRLALSKAMCDHSEIDKWSEHVKYWQDKLEAEEKERGLTQREPDKGDSPDLQALSTLGAGSALGDLS